MPKKTLALFSFVFIFSLFLAACGAEATPEHPLPSPPPDSSTSNLDLDTFKADLINVLSGVGLPSRDYTALQAFMGDSFSINGWGTGGSPASSSAEAIERLKSSHLPSTAQPVFDPNADFQALLDGSNPFDMFPGAVNFIYSDGWGNSGKSEALLVISQNADGSYYWDSVLIADMGFKYDRAPNTAEMNTADYNSFQGALLDALASNNRDYAALQTFMGDSFTINGWGTEGLEWTPSEAVGRLETLHLPATAQPIFDTNANFQDLLGGTDPFSVFPDAAYLIYSDGWGESGNGEALLVISQNADGNYYWDSVLIADIGFKYDRAPVAEEPQGAITTDYNTFQGALLEALTASNRDYNYISTFMGNPFEISLWLSVGNTYAPMEAAEKLRTSLLPPTAYMNYEIGADITNKLGSDAFAMFPGATSFIFTSGWETSGNAEAILVIAQNNDGTYYWKSVLIAPSGFSTVAPPADTALFDFKTSLASMLGAQGGRDYSNLQSNMTTPFQLIFTNGPGGQVSPSEFALNLENTVLPIETVNMFSPDFNRDYTALFNASDPTRPPEVVDYFYSTGWGPNGDLDALVLIGQTTDGYYQWSGLYITSEALSP